MLPSKPPSIRPSLEVADIFRGEAASFLRDYGHRLSSQQKRVFSDVRACRTAVMGGHVRVGLEDNIFIKKGVLAKSNAELVEKVVRIAREFDREIATPDEVRAYLGLKGKDRVNF